MNVDRAVEGTDRERVRAGMSRWVAGAGGAIIVGAIGLVVLLVGQQRTGLVDPRNGSASAETIALGTAIYAESCASCHGAELEGQPDWQQPLPSGRLPAPPHDETGHTWHHADQLLFDIVQNGTAAVVGGDYESDMPAFEDILNDEEIWAVLAFIKSRWPEREREFQALVTSQELEAR